MSPEKTVIVSYQLEQYHTTITIGQQAACAVWTLREAVAPRSSSGVYIILNNHLFAVMVAAVPDVFAFFITIGHKPVATDTMLFCGRKCGGAALRKVECWRFARLAGFGLQLSWR
jgi:hypothetical protein